MQRNVVQLLVSVTETVPTNAAKRGCKSEDQTALTAGNKHPCSHINKKEWKAGAHLSLHVLFHEAEFETVSAVITLKRLEVLGLIKILTFHYSWNSLFRQTRAEALGDSAGNQ